MTTTLRDALVALIGPEAGITPYRTDEEDNLARSTLAAQALLNFMDNSQCDEIDVESVFSDLIADLFHLGSLLHRQGLYTDFGLWEERVLVRAMNHFQAETGIEIDVKGAHPDAACSLLLYINNKKSTQHVATMASQLAAELSLIIKNVEGLPTANALLAVVSECHK
ncbi:hypothetical protein V1956_24230 [Yersinia sp. 2540 StPb PI]|uniref:hypothetical protein n=1 Tax=Yersinia sp. 2540 StPb PI TaxID=3117406 RepID=UPI003FA48470